MTTTIFDDDLNPQAKCFFCKEWLTIGGEDYAFLPADNPYVIHYGLGEGHAHQTCVDLAPSPPEFADPPPPQGIWTEGGWTEGITIGAGTTTTDLGDTVYGTTTDAFNYAATATTDNAAWTHLTYDLNHDPATVFYIGTGTDEERRLAFHANTIRYTVGDQELFTASYDMIDRMARSFGEEPTTKMSKFKKWLRDKIINWLF